MTPTTTQSRLIQAVIAADRRVRKLEDDLTTARLRRGRAVAAAKAGGITAYVLGRKIPELTANESTVGTWLRKWETHAAQTPGMPRT